MRSAPTLAILFSLVLGPSSALAQESSSADQEGATPEAEAASEERPSPRAPEEGPRRVVMLDVSFSDPLEPLRERLTDDLVRALRRSGLGVVEPQEVTQALSPMGSSLLSSCRGGVCVGWILDVLDGDSGLVVDVDGVENSYSVSFRLLGPYGDELGRAERRCDFCTFDELAELVAEAGEQTASQIPRRVVSGRVGVFPSPPRAEISVNGAPVGVGTLSIPLPVGDHIVSAALDGYRTTQREVTVQPGSTIRVDLVLPDGEDPRGPPPLPSLRPLRRWLWSVFGVGLAVGAGGSVTMGVGLGVGDQRERPLVISGIALLSAGLIAALVSGISVAFVPEWDSPE